MITFSGEPVEPIKWTRSGRVQVRRRTSRGGGRFFPVFVFDLCHSDGRDALARALATLPEESAR